MINGKSEKTKNGEEPELLLQKFTPNQVEQLKKSGMLRYAEHVQGDMYRVKKFIELDEESDSSTHNLTQQSTPEKEFGFVENEESEKPLSPVFVDEHVE